ncbi:ABC transporter [Deltaproteobacteria bacterium Smac51]|nr:ABC transporter [Deltaproteobacteria bacterium Smac51]
MLRIKNLGFSYEPGLPILAGLDFAAEPGRIVGLAGANGSGKSTLVNVLAGILEPDEGSISFEGFEGVDALERLRTTSALLPQNIDHWLLGETAEEDLKLGLDLADESVASLLAELTERWQLTGLLEKPVEVLSLGQKKRLALASALARRPALIFMDEPMSGLDWDGTKTMLADLARLKEAGVITILVTHEPGLVAPLVDDWLLLKAGGDYAFGAAPDIFARFEEFRVRPV